MRLSPRTLVGQTVAILLAGVVLSNLIGLAVYGGWPPDLLTNPRGRALAEQIEALASGLSETPRAAHPPALRPWRQPGWRAWASERPLVEVERPTWRTRLFRQALLAALADGGTAASEGLRDDPGRLRLTQAPRREIARAAEASGGGGWRRSGEARRGDGPPGAGGGGLGGRGGEEAGGDVAVLAGALRLPDGGWLNFVTPAATVEPLWATPAFAFGLTATSLLAVVAAWAARRATRPLAELAQACERLGRDLAAPPVPDEGPQEVRAAARAFNRMQRDLATFVRDRTRMLAAISHDLRTPLTRLRLRAELIEDEELRQRSLADLDEMQAMIAATLAFARDDAAAEPLAWLDLAALIATVCDEAADVGGDVVFRADGGTGGGAISYLGRPLALKRAFANLVGNAVAHGGNAVVTVTGGAEDVLVTFEDDGPGLPEEQLERVFEPFVRGDDARGRARGGVGLGLPIARAILAAHGGTLTLANRAPGGLVARARLPRTQPARAKSSSGAAF